MRRKCVLKNRSPNMNLTTIDWIIRELSLDGDAEDNVK